MIGVFVRFLFYTMQKETVSTEYYSCLSITESKSSNLLLRVLMFSFSSFIYRSFSRLSCLHSWNFSLIKLIDSCKSVSCAVPLIWFSCVVCVMSLRIFISFSKFCKQLNRMLTHSGDFNPSTKTSVFSETDESFKLPWYCFLLDSPRSSELLLKFLFLIIRLIFEKTEAFYVELDKRA